MLKIGCHLSTEKGYEAMGLQILAMGGNTFQYFTKNPRGRSSTKAPDPADVEALNALIREGISFLIPTPSTIIILAYFLFCLVIGQHNFESSIS